jgi:hypothetical protein
MTSGALIRWARLNERRSRVGWWTSPWLVAGVAGALLAAFVTWRADEVGPVAASHAWFGGALVAFATAFMRVPFHLYWRSDAALLAQLPIDGNALFDAAMLRAVRAAAATTLAVILGAAPLAVPRLAGSSTLYQHHVLFAGVLFLTAAALMPAVAMFGAMIVAGDQAQRALAFATALGGAPTSASGQSPKPKAQSPSPPASTALLGALPGFVSSIVLALVIVVAPWLYGGSPSLPPAVVLGAIAAASVVAIVLARGGAARTMGTILRDVSALDRQRLATLEIRPPTAIERGVAGLLGDGALPYRKDARLMRRRYPMAFALGALVFIVLVIIGIARPADPMPYFIVVLGGSAIYALALAGRLRRPPISLPRLEVTLPIAPRATRRARIAWLLAWFVVFVAIPATFALVRV